MMRLFLGPIGMVFFAACLAGDAPAQNPEFPDIARPGEEKAAAAADSPYSLSGGSTTRRPFSFSPQARPAAHDEPESTDAPAETSGSLYGDSAAEPSVEPSGPADGGNVLRDDPAIAQPAPTEPTPTNSAVNNDLAETLPPPPEKTHDPAAEPSVAKAAPPATTAAAAPLAGNRARIRQIVQRPIHEIWGQFLAVWKMKVFKEVTVEEVVLALLLIVVAYILANRISKWFSRRVLSRLGLEPNSAAIVQKIAFYTLLAAFTLVTLNTLGVPVTVFSFFGGALAVGIGFGSQNIVNNFISGLILLAERPIRVGDVIQIDGVTGKVTEIGARSTRVTTGANMEILVPNSSILQGNVVNWTLTDDVISSKITVGVAYGSPARTVARLLQQAAEENTNILKDPAPSVSFTNFGDHALEFELSFWLRLSVADRGRTESDLRFAVDDLFGEHGIIIAYPQRDVHLNLLRPVEVRLTPPATGELRRAAA